MDNYADAQRRGVSYGAAARDREESDGAELNRQIACRVNAGL
jgi:hypothetical protein